MLRDAIAATTLEAVAKEVGISSDFIAKSSRLFARMTHVTYGNGVAPRVLPMVSAIAIVLAWVTRAGHAESPIAACRRLTGYRGPASACWIDKVGGGAGRVVRIETECGGDSCSVSAWVRSAATGGMRELPAYDAGEIEMTPTGDAVVFDDIMSEPGKERVTLVRVDLATGALTPFARCMSAVLSPGKRWFACRGKNGDVLRVPVAGGRVERVAAARVHNVWFTPYSRRYPNAVTFPDAEHVRFTIDADGAPIERVVAWRE